MYVDEQQQTWGYGNGAVPGSAAASAPFRAGRYVILQHVGHGAMGNVYAAYDPDLDRKVAVKVLRDSTRGRPLPASLAREAKAMAKLVHPHVVTVFDVGHCERGGFVAMEYVEGLTLRSWLKQQQRSWREVLPAFVQAGPGAAHLPAVHTPLTQSAGPPQPSPTSQSLQGPPQSMSLSPPFFTPSPQPAAAHLPALHTMLGQSAPTRHSTH